MNDYAYNRSITMENVITDAYGFRKDSGVIKLLTSASRGQYAYVFETIFYNKDSNPLWNLRAMDEILENKWFIHAYDINGILN